MKFVERCFAFTVSIIMLSFLAGLSILYEYWTQPVFSYIVPLFFVPILMISSVVINNDLLFSFSWMYVGILMIIIGIYIKINTGEILSLTLLIMGIFIIIGNVFEIKKKLSSKHDPPREQHI